MSASKILRPAILCFAALLLAHSALEAEDFALLGIVVVPKNLVVAGTAVGGLSGVSYDAATRSFWAISDDSTHHGGPPRAYRYRLKTTGTGVLTAEFLQMLPMRGIDGKLLPVADMEGIAATGQGSIWISSEGKAGKRGDVPWLRLFSLKSGKMLRDLPIPPVYLPADASGQPVRIGDPAQVSGMLNNRALESCALSPDLRTVYTANEASLLQEKAPGEGLGGAGVFNHTQVRISALDARMGRCLSQKLYVADNGCFFGSISDLFCLDGANHLLVLERRVIALHEGPGSCQFLLYRVDLGQPDATDLRKIASVNDMQVTPLSKTLIFDSEQAGLTNVDNIEGICLAPAPGGGQMLVGISDNNFNAHQQTQILLIRYP